jgi:hypothetical protein
LPKQIRIRGEIGPDASIKPALRCATIRTPRVSRGSSVEDRCCAGKSIFVDLLDKEVSNVNAG